ncbi:MAG: substrate-binding domain-containing protein, partial [Bacilli bacterium]
MKKRIIPFVALALTATVLASCGEASSWSWSSASSDGVLKYCLLIGQIDHNDSAARTAGIRDALGTRGTVKTNANTEDPVEGKLTIGGKSYTVIEAEHAEQKNTGGATWDQQTATNTTETWLNKHSDIDFFVSNNDGMAVGAIGASNWIDGLPIFGYDSNADMLQYIADGKTMGTINQNASAQAAGIFMLARNCIDDLGTDKVTSEGFSTANSKGYGQISSNYTLNETNGSMLVDNFAITKDNVSSYLGKEPADLIDSKVTKGTTDKAKVWMSYYSQSDTFLNSNMAPLFNIYKDTFNLDVTALQGDGNSENTVSDKLESADNDYKAYIINMIKTTSTA